jgi:hypothetical protein
VFEQPNTSSTASTNISAEARAGSWMSMFNIAQKTCPRFVRLMPFMAAHPPVQKGY